MCLRFFIVGDKTESVSSWTECIQANESGREHNAIQPWAHLF